MRCITIGIDEVGRGPLAGPVTLGACAILDTQLVRKIFPKIKDSKQLSVKGRGEWYKKILVAQKNNLVVFATASFSARFIDQYGLSRAIKSALSHALEKVVKKSSELILEKDSYKFEILLDGSLKAPDKYTNQKTIIKGDSKILAIALASIVAKVRRDNFMNKLHAKYPMYNFDIHKGYGTRSHIEAIRKYGFSPEHRRTFAVKL